MEAGYCIKCPFKTPTQRKYGITYLCNKDCTHMDVTFYTHEIYSHRQNLLCPLLIKDKRNNQ